MSYAIATYDTSFKYLFSLSSGSPESLVLSFLNSVLPPRESPFVAIEEMSIAIPPVTGSNSSHNSVYMDLHLRASTGDRVIIEMQVRRHDRFDERVLFYAANTYARQLNNTQLGKDCWYDSLKPVIALVLLDYDTTLIRKTDTMSTRVSSAPRSLASQQYEKHYKLTDEVTGQCIDHLQIIQIELPRACKAMQLFPPAGCENSVQWFKQLDSKQWWLTLLKNANKFTPELVTNLHNEKVMPTDIYEAFNRLCLKEWAPDLTEAYNQDVVHLHHYTEVLNAAVKERTATLEAELMKEREQRKRERDDNAELRKEIERMKAAFHSSEQDD